MPESPSTFDIAYSLLREGRLIDAEQLMLKELQSVEQSHGRTSSEWASAQCDLGNLLFNSDQFDRAAECFRDACAHPPVGDSAAFKNFLTYRLNLGMALLMAGRLDEAEAELRRNLREREEFYGREHPGYAYALEQLADVLIRRGELAQARQAAEEAVGIFWEAGHERVAGAMALRAEIVLASGGGDAVFPGLDQLPDEIVELIVLTVTARVRQVPATARPVLTHLAATLESHLGPDHQATLKAFAELANSGHDSGDQTGRVEAIEKLLASYDRQGRAEDALMAVLGLAVAQDAAGDVDGSLKTYEQALARADGIGRHDLRAQVLRNWGLALSSAGRPAEAEQRLRAAVTEAGLSGDDELLGRARIALGLFLQHEERLDEARELVEAGLTTLDVAHPEAIQGRGHLGAIMAGRSCGCGDTREAIAQAFREFVIGRLPHDLLAELEVTLDGGDFQIGVQLVREPTEDELKQLNAVFESATAEFRGRLAAAG
ncbi:Gll2226 protein [[Actinomadura] parvosata subsp. kistnae]|uniref:Uncharacterized protein n=2 Tax=Nonomuraea TaxID=83681 RepID=A0A1V0AIP7_9ACTN|nr:hypothetical protein BKM31_58505 [Nonomuraea sp. ATCC 55076]SPL90288.1 Gll2226 protein [Actinomadura parvosata subsp. kistnae]